MIPDLCDIGAIYKVLPHGRYLTDFDEVAQKYALGKGSVREELLDDLVYVTNLLRDVSEGIYSLWIGGSFVSSKEEPGDIDVVFIMKVDSFEKAKGSPEGIFVLEQLFCVPKEERKRPFSSVDAYLLGMPPTTIKNEPETYLQNRGYWDQFWSKTRFSKCDVVEYPKCGYLEVVLDA